MIKRIQRKFILIAMISMFIVTICIVGTINFINVYRQNMEVTGILKLISDNDGYFPSYDKFGKGEGKIDLYKYVLEDFQITPETAHLMRYFSIKVDDDNKIVDSNLVNVISVNENDLNKIVNDILDENDESGNYKEFEYLITKKSDYTLIVFLDGNSYKRNQNHIAFYSIFTSIVAMLVVFILVSKLSKLAIRSVIENEEKQKEFITNAGHELKTPIAIILANNEVLKMKYGNDEWLESNENQAKRLDVLVKGLLKLSRGEEENFKADYTEFNMSELVEKVTGSFKSIAKNNEIVMDIMPDVELFADEEMIYELISILIDNSIKYVTKDGKITVRLWEKGKNVRLDIANDCDNLTKQDCQKMFERFYRKDKSRNRDNKKGGYGIGLSMAKRIVSQHKGKIFANYDNGVIHFIVIFNKFNRKYTKSR